MSNTLYNRSAQGNRRGQKTDAHRKCDVKRTPGASARLTRLFTAMQAIFRPITSISLSITLSPKPVGLVQFWVGSHLALFCIHRVNRVNLRTGWEAWTLSSVLLPAALWGIAIRSVWMQISWKRLEIEAVFQWTPKMKWHTAHQMARVRCRSVTLECQGSDPNTCGAIISKTAGDTDSVTIGSTYRKWTLRVSNGRVPDDVTWPWKVKFMPWIYLDAIISKALEIGARFQ